MGVPKDQIIELPQPKGMYFHIDGLMTGFRNGVVALNDPALMLKELKSIDTSQMSRLEKKLLESHIDSTTKEMKDHQKTYQQIQETLKKQGFDVQSVPAYSDASDWRNATITLRRALMNPSEEEFKKLQAKNSYIKMFVEEYGKNPMDPKLEQRYERRLGEEYKNNPLSLQFERALFHVSRTVNSRILLANGIGGVDESGKGFFITNADKTFPSLNKAFEKAVVENSEQNGMNTIEMIEHSYPNMEGGIQCLTNEIVTQEK